MKRTDTEMTKLGSLIDRVDKVIYSIILLAAIVAISTGGDIVFTAEGLAEFFGPTQFLCLFVIVLAVIARCCQRCYWVHECKENPPKQEEEKIEVRSPIFVQDDMQVRNQAAYEQELLNQERKSKQ